MKISKLPFQGSLKAPKEIERIRTSDLIEGDTFISFKNPGLPYYNPIGNIVLEKLRSLTNDAHTSQGVLKFKIPGYMKRDVLNEGENISKTFEEKFVMLPEPMESYMVLTTHEMEVLDWLKKDNLSHKTLPLKLFFNRDILRPIKNPKGILKLREFETQIMLSLNANENQFRESLETYSTLSERILKKLQIPFKKCAKNISLRRAGNLDFDLEYFYPCSEGENICTGNSRNEKEKAFSLMAGYRYVPFKEIVMYASVENKIHTPIIGTYVMGLERLLYSAFDNSKDKKGFNLPESISPFDYSILTFDENSKTIENAETIYNLLSQKGKRVLYDDRSRCKRIEKAKYSDFIGIPLKIILSKSGIGLVERVNDLIKSRFENIGDIIDPILNYKNRK